MMRLKQVLLLALALVLSISCNRVLVPIEIVSTKTKIDSTIQSENFFLDSMLTVYSNDMGDLLERKVIISEDQLQKRRPESALGNYMSDAVLWAAKKISKDSVDFAFVNLGGIRNSLPKGNVTVRNIFELMPFDNQIVILELKGEQFLELLGQIKKIGFEPQAGLAFVDGHWVLRGQEVKDTKHYHIAVSDYVASGGDNYQVLTKAISRVNTGIAIRDCIIAYFDNLNNQGIKLNSKYTGRINLE